MAERFSRRRFIEFAGIVAASSLLNACGQEITPSPTVAPAPEANPVPPTTAPVENTAVVPTPEAANTAIARPEAQIPPATKSPTTASVEPTEQATPKVENKLPKQFQILGEAKRTTRNGDVKIIVQGTLNQERLNIDEISKDVNNLIAESKAFVNPTIVAVTNTLIEYIEKSISAEGLTQEDRETLQSRTKKLREYLEKELKPTMSERWVRNVTGTEQASLSEELKKIAEQNTNQYLFEDTQAEAYAGIVLVQADSKETEGKIVNGNSELETFAQTCAELISGVALWSATEKDIADDSQGEPKKLIRGRKIVTGEDEVVDPTAEAISSPETDIFVVHEKEIRFNGGLVKIRFLVDKKAFEDKGVIDIGNKLNSRDDIFSLADASGEVISRLIEYFVNSGFDQTKIDQIAIFVEGENDYTLGLGAVAYSETDPDFVLDELKIPAKGELKINDDDNSMVSEGDTLTLLNIDDKREVRYQTSAVLTDIEVYSSLPETERLRLERIDILIKFINRMSSFCDLSVLTAIVSEKDNAGENSINYVRGQHEILAKLIIDQTKLLTSN